MRHSNPVFREHKLPDKTHLQPIVPSDINLISAKQLADDVCSYESSDDEAHGKKYFCLQSDKTLERVTEQTEPPKSIVTTELRATE